MAKTYKPNKKGIITGTNKKDNIVWNSAWQKSLTVKALAGKDTIDFRKSKFKNNLYGGTGDDKIYGGSNSDKIQGDNGNDMIYGGAGNDKLYGNAGNDKIWGGKGNDTIDGGIGNDSLYGEDGNDLINGSYGIDIIKGGAGNDIVKGGEGDDWLYGGKGLDYLFGEDGNDVIYCESGTNFVYGGRGNDTIFDGTGNDSITGDIGNDTIYLTKSGNNIVNGDKGDDKIYCNTNNNQIDGGDGVNKIYFTNPFGGYKTNYIKGTKGYDELIFDSKAVYARRVDDDLKIWDKERSNTVIFVDYFNEIDTPVLTVKNGDRTYTIAQLINKTYSNHSYIWGAAPKIDKIDYNVDSLTQDAVSWSTTTGNNDVQPVIDSTDSSKISDIMLYYNYSNK